MTNIQKVILGCGLLAFIWIAFFHPPLVGYLGAQGNVDARAFCASPAAEDTCWQILDYGLDRPRLVLNLMFIALVTLILMVISKRRTHS
ncbi:hypothetical protein [Deinococcus sp. Leaf326]|uniref:hypothetical protein n=1 Tax=Deinococcus sp. Leaf326 TaxID=1736338 RepID=UPI000701969A|nr:hypothetical protein [Deinococcus sp. Leaf326]KQR00079.1 hypothetical protein ASF71_21830 [Deinococcus sp. Leaf326]